MIRDMVAASAVGAVSKGRPATAALSSEPITITEVRYRYEE